MRHGEFHKIQNTNWLRAAVLGANDGIISTSSLIMGVATAHADEKSILLTGIAGLVAGALSMAAGEYVSVRSQADVEASDLARERLEIATQPDAELRELTEIYVMRGVSRELAQDVATQLMAHDALGAHARDELGITEFTSARPLQAACASALSFSLGALVPVMVVIFTDNKNTSFSIAAISIAALALLGALAAKAGGAKILTGALRVGIWGAGAMGITAAAGYFFGANI